MSRLYFYMCFQECKHSLHIWIYFDVFTLGVTIDLLALILYCSLCPSDWPLLIWDPTYCYLEILMILHYCEDVISKGRITAERFFPKVCVSDFSSLKGWDL